MDKEKELRLAAILAYTILSNIKTEEARIALKALKAALWPK